MLDSFTFYTDTFSFGIETKGTEKAPYVTGYISTPDIDLYHDIVTDECLNGMLMQIKSGKIKLDIDHEAWRDHHTKIPIGKIVDAHRDVKGLWIKAVLNKHSPAFKAAWNSIKDGFLDAFSIAYKPVKTVDKVVNGLKARLLQEVQLLNVAITGNPVNPECKMQSVFVKSIQTLEVDKMETKCEEKPPEEKEKTQPAEVKAEPEPKVEEPAPKEKKKDEEETEEEEKKSLDELTKRLEAQEKEIAELKAQLEKPVLKAQVEEKSAENAEEEFKSSCRSPLQLIR